MYVSEKSQSHIEIKDYSGTSLCGYTHMLALFPVSPR